MQYVNENTSIGDIIFRYPEAIEVLTACGMHCLGCPASQAETLKEACAVHRISPSVVVSAVNRKITASR